MPFHERNAKNRCADRGVLRIPTVRFGSKAAIRPTPITSPNLQQGLPRPLPALRERPPNWSNQLLDQQGPGRGPADGGISGTAVLLNA